MATTYYIKINIESAGTGYTGGGLPFSVAGHMWYQTYQKDANGTISNVLDSGYTGDGIVNKDGVNYDGEPAYSSNEHALTQEQFDMLLDFGDPTKSLAEQNGFGPDDYNLANNSCIDYVWKGLELIGLNKGKFEGDIVPMCNQDSIDNFFKNNPNAWNDWNSLSDNDKSSLSKYGFIPYDVSDPNLGDDNHVTIPDDGIPPVNPTPPEPPRRDPLVLDTDKDGFISTIALENSNTYFDITGDGIKEKVSWIGANDGILTYDKNGNGKIDGIDEVFGNMTTSGFDELKQLIDSNGNGVIDRRDELFSRLQIWHDTNGDGISQKDELVTLKEEGVKSINANNVITTDIELGGATLSEASKYTDSEGNKELVADVNLEYNPTLTTIDTATIPDYSIDLDTLTLPNLRGYGFFLNSFVSYNTNDTLKEKAQELINNGVESMSNEFEEFIDIWSGYTEYVNVVKDKLSITGDIGLSELDKKVWIIDRLFGRDTNATAIEANFESEMQEYQNTRVVSEVSSSVTIEFQEEYYNDYFTDTREAA